MKRIFVLAITSLLLSNVSSSLWVVMKCKPGKKYCVKETSQNNLKKSKNKIPNTKNDVNYQQDEAFVFFAALILLIIIGNFKKLKK